MIRRFFQLVCDQCEKQSEIAPVEALKGSWHFDEYLQSIGYRYYSLTCSKECQRNQRALYEERLRAIPRGELPLELAVRSDAPNHMNWPEGH